MRSPLLLGGLLPALLFGLDGLCSKLAARAGIGLGPYIAVTGSAIVAVGLLLSVLVPERAVTASGAAYAFAKGCAWAAGSALILYVLARGGAPLGKLAPLYNTNALVTVVLALVIFAEWREVSVPKLLAGAALIIAGATLVSRA